jgi:hypothetical protein
VIQHHPHRALPHLGRKLVRRLPHKGSTFSGVAASSKPGAVHFPGADAAKVGVYLEWHNFGEATLSGAADQAFHRAVIALCKDIRLTTGEELATLS